MSGESGEIAPQPAQIFSLIEKAFPERGLRLNRRTSILRAKLFRGAWRNQNLEVAEVGWKFLVRNREASYMVNAIRGADSKWSYLVQAASEAAWQTLFRSLRRRMQSQHLPDFEMRWLDVTSAHQAFLWAHLAGDRDWFLPAHNHGQAWLRKRLLDFDGASNLIGDASREKERALLRADQLRGERFLKAAVPGPV